MTETAEDSEVNLARRMADFSRALSPPSDLDSVLGEATAMALETLSGAEMANVLLTHKGGRFESLASTSEVADRLDEVQGTHGEGPCFDAATGELVNRTDDFATDRRWPRFAAVAVELGVRSNLSLRLYGSDRTAGALNVFSTRPNAFTAESEAVGLVLASHVATAVLASRNSEQLQSAVLSRDIIGQAKGIVMERFGVDDRQAFNLLRRLSQADNVALAEIAQSVIDTRSNRG